MVALALFWLFAILGGLGILGCLGASLTLLTGFRARGLPTADEPAPEPASSLSLIVPLKGADAQTEAHLAALVASRVDGPVEYLLAMESPDDPAHAIGRRIQARYPDRDVRIVISGPASGRMGKQHNLAAAVREARYAVIGSMDADVGVDPDTLAVGLRAVADPRIGVAYFLPIYRGLGPLGGLLVALYTNYYFSFNVGALALRTRAPLVIGALWLIRRSTLEAIGGLDQFGLTVSDDGAIGREVLAHGLRNVLIPRTVSLPYEPLVLRGGARHLLKWLTLLRAEGLAPFIVILATWHPILWSVAALIVAALDRDARGRYVGYGGALVVGALLARGGGATLVRRRVYRTQGFGLPLLLAPYELLAVPVLFGAAFFRRTIEWRGRFYRLGPHGAIRSVREPAGRT
jgi:ceramide glucosyltransferase